TLKTSLDTLTRVLDVVHWPTISKGTPEAWLYFYEGFLSVYDNALRRQTGSYYTPPEIVTAMVRLVDETLRDERRFGVAEGLASPNVTLADPAMGTGTFLLGVLQRIVDRIKEDQGEGAVPGAIRAALARIIGFEIQFGPFAVAQLRLAAEVVDLLKADKADPEHVALRLFLTDTLGNPNEEHEYIPHMLSPLAASRRDANQIKRAEPITVVIGNPPYRERARGRGGWVESGTANIPAPLRAWMPPVEWGVSAHVKHLRNLYVYFWRWATWKVFGGSIVTPDTPPVTRQQGVVCFITVAGFLNGPGFQKMRADLRRDTDEIWVIDCSPEGHQPPVASRVFQAVQQPVCVVLAVRLAACDPDTPARVRFRSLPVGTRDDKFEAISDITLDSDGWTDCSVGWRAPFLPAATGEWGAFTALDDFFVYNGSGVMPGRTWVIAPDRESLARRWDALNQERNSERKELLFHPHMPRGELGDRHLAKVPSESLHGHERRMMSVASDQGPVVAPIRYGFRSFDRQWIIPDYRLLNRPNPTIWKTHSTRQVYLTALVRSSPTSGPALTFTASIPDLDHYKGSFGGRAFPLWANAAATEPNICPAILAWLSEIYGRAISAEDVIAYLAAVAANPAYTARFAPDLVQPGLRIPLTGDPTLFGEAARLGREVIWLHTFGERFADPTAGRPARPPRLSQGAPRIPADGAISSDPEHMPDTISYDAVNRRLWIGCGHIDHVLPAVWAYEVSGKHVLTQWFSYRKKHRERPQIGDRRTPSPLGDIQPDAWPAEYTTDLLNVLNVLGRLVALEPAQADLLQRICAGPTLTQEALRYAS
ncbi:MAG: type ISP restriction/modification enzyme, partial [Stellaceae bacterium]